VTRIQPIPPELDSSELEEYEQVAFYSDEQTGLRAVIAIHDTTLGPAIGGCRMWPFADESEALRDVLRLARGMTYKNAMADLPLGGGKAVILGDPKRDKSTALLRAFGAAVEDLGGRYLTAEDVGMTVDDIETIRLETSHVVGRRSGPAASNDPSPFTAFGVFEGIRASVRHKLGRDLEGIRVAVQGIGNVGRHLCRYLHDAGARLQISDLNEGATLWVAEELGAEIVDPSCIASRPVDVFAPCALGGVLNDASIPDLATPIVAGAANNQLAEPRHAATLMQRGILYAPDYVINAGGVINIAGEVAGCYDRKRALDQIGGIGERLCAIFEQAEAERRPTHDVANDMAESKLAQARSMSEHTATAVGSHPWID
jgi:leucine dehydrogenase